MASGSGFAIEPPRPTGMMTPMLTRALLRLAGICLVAGFFAGCQTVHDVTVDAISDRTKPLGASYHLEVEDPTGGIDSGLHEMAVATIKDALAARGLYEVPATTRADMKIDASYRIGHGHVKIVTQANTDALIGPGITPLPTSKAVVVYDKTLELTARTPAPPPAPGDAPGPVRPGAELWSVKAKIVDNKQQLAPYLPALASACIDYIGENPGREITLPVEAAQAKLLLQQRPVPPAAAPAAAQNR